MGGVNAKSSIFCDIVTSASSLRGKVCQWKDYAGDMVDRDKIFHDTVSHLRMYLSPASSETHTPALELLERFVSLWAPLEKTDKTVFVLKYLALYVAFAKKELCARIARTCTIARPYSFSLEDSLLFHDALLITNVEVKAAILQEWRILSSQIQSDCSGSRACLSCVARTQRGLKCHIDGQRTSRQTSHVKRDSLLLTGSRALTM